MCDTLNHEIGHLADDLNHHHGGATAAVAVLLYVTSCLFTSYGQAHGADLMPLLAVQRGAVDVFMEQEGVGGGTLDAALADLSRANVTVAYLASLPE